MQRALALHFGSEWTFPDLAFRLTGALDGLHLLFVYLFHVEMSFLRNRISDSKNRKAAIPPGFSEKHVRAFLINPRIISIICKYLEGINSADLAGISSPLADAAHHRHVDNLV